MSTPRIPPVGGDDARAAAHAVDLPEYLADLEVFRTLLQHPSLAAGFNGWLAPLLLKGRLDRRLRELIIMRLGWTTGSVYEWTQHWRIATALGVPEEDLLAVRNWRRYDGFGQAERAVLAATDDVVAHGVIGDEAWSECERVLTTVEERLELVAVTAGWWMVSSMLRSLRVPLEDGVAPWPPDGVEPGAT